ncbi:hypothetical protein BV20DRAFT_638351 [Pilatotrama ljubarskyi]|nr:hypothetical protein BV20DRAFT_638351 [Pilatotrama ljubarskyi]
MNATARPWSQLPLNLMFSPLSAGVADLSLVPRTGLCYVALSILQCLDHRPADVNPNFRRPLLQSSRALCVLCGTLPWLRSSLSICTSTAKLSGLELYFQPSVCGVSHAYTASDSPETSQGPLTPATAAHRPNGSR